MKKLSEKVEFRGIEKYLKKENLSFEKDRERIVKDKVNFLETESWKIFPTDCISPNIKTIKSSII